MMHGQENMKSGSVFLYRMDKHMRLYRRKEKLCDLYLWVCSDSRANYFPFRSRISVLRVLLPNTLFLYHKTT